ncbi:hypothetical protein EVAR_937_1 [Eumeta japonica]|uniref:Uncharacterized protein n=1 Tax=Eumeta variegata TaxID=151549 RepID=A0A4C1SGX7_EUMVA|nr:hypothetical protein EVAR_937_1 [Eumeta japonica]
MGDDKGLAFVEIEDLPLASARRASIKILKSLAWNLCSITKSQCTKLCRSELPANDVMPRFNTPRLFHFRPHMPILRHSDAFVANFIAAKLPALRTALGAGGARGPRRRVSIYADTCEGWRLLAAVTVTAIVIVIVIGTDAMTTSGMGGLEYSPRHRAVWSPHIAYMGLRKRQRQRRTILQRSFDPRPMAPRSNVTFRLTSVGRQRKEIRLDTSRSLRIRDISAGDGRAPWIEPRFTSFKSKSIAKINDRERWTR